jgi:methionine synthase II (cobalamin-independent)
MPSIVSILWPSASTAKHQARAHQTAVDRHAAGATVARTAPLLAAGQMQLVTQDVTTAVHICFGYAAIIHQRPSAYSFLPELEAADVQQISIETAQSTLDCKVLAALSSKTSLLGVLDLADMTVETPAIVADRIRRALPYIDANKIVVAPDCGLKYLPREVAFGKIRAMVEGALVVRGELS